MRRIVPRLVLILTLPLVAPLAAADEPARLEAAAQAVQQLITRSGAEVAVAWQPLDAGPGEALLINPTLRFHAASTMKVPVVIELLRRVDAGQLDLDATMVVENHFTSIVDGTPYTLSASRDSDGAIYEALGEPRSYRALAEASIIVSSNLATNLLIERLGARRVQQTMDELGASGMQVLRGVEDMKAFDAGMNNTTDAEALLTLFLAIGTGRALSPAGTTELLGILQRQAFTAGIPAGVTPGTAVAHKTGRITAIHHDAGIVYADRPYVLVVLTRGIDDEDESNALIAAISRVLADAVE